jgi:hypothetical protein
MLKKTLLAVACVAFLPLAATLPALAADPPADQGMTAPPEDPDAAPYPPDGVTDPNAEYPVDGAEGTDQGEPGAEPAPGPAAQPAPAPAAPPPAKGKAPD